MTTFEIMEEIKKLEPIAQIDLAESTLRLVREDIRKAVVTKGTDGESRQLRQAASVLLTEYRSNHELTAFSVLDSEEFHE